MSSYGKASSPNVYLDGVGIQRDTLNARSDEISSIEHLAFLAALEKHPQKKELNQIMEDIEVSCNNKYKRPVRGLGPMGSLELVAKLGIFLSLIPERDISVPRRK